MNEPRGGDKPPTERQRHSYNNYTDYKEFKVVVTKFRDFNAVEIGRIIKRNISKENVKETVITGRKSAVVYCVDRTTANHVANLQDFKDNGYEAYIPIYYITSCGIIRGINKQYSEEEIKNEIDARQVKVYKVERIKRKDTVDGQPEYAPTERMKIFFEGNEIPQYIYINSVRIPCEPFIRFTRQCQLCWEYTHSTRTCTKRSPKCKTCGDEGHSSIVCDQPPKCISCKGNHPADYINCPEKSRQENINRAIALNNMSANEAATIYPRPQMKRDTFAIVTGNRYDLLAEHDDYDEEFPTINEAVTKRKPKYVIPRKIPTHNNPLNQTKTQKTRESMDVDPIPGPSRQTADAEINEDGTQRERRLHEVRERRKRMLNQSRHNRADEESDWTNMRDNKLRDIKPTIHPWTTSVRRSRREETALCRIRIGHTALTHLHLIKKEESKECDQCKEAETVNHIIFKCSKYQEERRRNKISENPQIA
uniref:CCHC-type domain-containing protein n=1 Tax=Phlebotomus papatasi TaxID=29031 RepID=A0A1B0DG77_PHLPP